MSDLPLEERRFDRLEEFDERSRGYRMLSVAPPEEPTSVIWLPSPADPTKPVGAGDATLLWEAFRPMPSPLPLDQGAEGACVGFGTTHAIMVHPQPLAADNAFARNLYLLAQKLDQYAETPPEEGSSVLGGLKAAQQMELISAYVWGFNTLERRRGLMRGPIVAGSAWLEGMKPDEHGVLAISGDVLGGHCYCIVGQLLDFDWPGHGRDHWRLILQSWGPDYGLGGIVGVRESEHDALLANGGETALGLVEVPPASANLADRYSDTY